MTSSVKVDRATNHPIIEQVSHGGQCYYTQYQLAASCKLCLEDIPSTHALRPIAACQERQLYPTSSLPNAGNHHALCRNGVDGLLSSPATDSFDGTIQLIALSSIVLARTSQPCAKKMRAGFLSERLVIE